MTSPLYTNASQALIDVAHRIMANGAEVGSRAGRTMELTHTHFALVKPWQRELIVEGRKPNVAAQIAETMWVLSGRNDIEWLGHYLPRAAEFSDDGETWRAGYGPRLRSWDTTIKVGQCEVDCSEAPFCDHTSISSRVDQFTECYQLLKADPSSRRAVMSIWDPAVDYADSKDIPCNNWLSWSSRLGHLDLSVAIRSNDLWWGWSGINQFEWSALQEIMAGMLGLRVGKLVFTQTSLHIYDRHWGGANKLTPTHAVGQLEDSPRFNWASVPVGVGSGTAVSDLDALIKHWFELEYDIRTRSSAVQGYVDSFPEPMLRSWLRVLQWWWGGGSRDRWMSELQGTRLWHACDPRFSVQPQTRDMKARGEIVIEEYSACPKCAVGQLTTSQGRHPLRCMRASCRFEPDSLISSGYSPFILALTELHTVKEAAYGGSWKKRGELFSIIPNIARKVDRLSGGTTEDETSADTAGDLLVYLAKHLAWLYEQQGAPGVSSDTVDAANDIMLDLDRTASEHVHPDSASLRQYLTATFNELADAAEARASLSVKAHLVSKMLRPAYALARRLWEAEQLEYNGADID